MSAVNCIYRVTNSVTAYGKWHTQASGWMVVTCSVGVWAVAQLVANHTGEVATNGSHGHEQRCPVSGDPPHLLGDDGSLVEPSEAGVRPPRLATNQRRVGHVDADGDMMDGLCKDRRTDMSSNVGRIETRGRKRARLQASRTRIMVHGCLRGSKTKNPERHLVLSGDAGSGSEPIMRSEREVLSWKMERWKTLEAEKEDVKTWADELILLEPKELEKKKKGRKAATKRQKSSREPKTRRNRRAKPSGKFNFKCSIIKWDFHLQKKTMCTGVKLKNIHNTYDNVEFKSRRAKTHQLKRFMLLCHFHCDLWAKTEIFYCIFFKWTAFMSTLPHCNSLLLFTGLGIAWPFCRCFVQ